MTTPVQPERQGWRRWRARIAPTGPWDALIRLALAFPPGLAVAALSGIGHRWIDILAQFTAPALVATALLTGLLALTRFRMAALQGAVACVALLVAVAPQWFPRGPEPEAGAPIVRLYSANLWARNGEVDAMAASVREADADIVVLIELGDVAAGRLDEVLAGYPHRVATPRIDRSSGAARSIIASRYPLTVIADRPDGLHAVGASVRTPVGPVHVLGVHLTRPWPFQEQWGQIEQTMAIGAIRADLTGPMVVAGDFNSVSSARIGRQMQRETGLRPASGFPGTWPSGLPAVAGVSIDQVYASPDLAFVRRRLGQPTGSDHRPVVSEFTRAAR
ncbi:endonuclease/exonuclease/phosphatase family protein [Brevundimonas sp.]|uniref:endonuclease/exonuclease/phosphatase family protein n=1 Tax=Brevundimonas sp. TaxID=1871086 RepID=UPI002D31CF8F|nr:endonuclease/exonuclease/phosphatase family protein [Brevundimonas sp.]HYC67585.1 endonuclease/exonuclease/phosphatase family protein [Brevundimonas sp.]